MVQIETFFYTLDVSDMHRLTPQAAQVLTESELERWRKFRVAQAREVFLASRFLLRRVLCERIGCEPAAIEFALAEHGKPYLKDSASPWRFNLSHSHDCVLLAVAEGLELGVDVEQHKARVALADMAERVLTADEQAQFFALDAPSRQRFFFDTWVLKESYIKLNGTGIWAGLNTLATDAGAPSYPGDRRTQVVYLSAPEGYSAALAHPAQPVEIRQQQLQRLTQ